MVGHSIDLFCLNLLSPSLLFFNSSLAVAIGSAVRYSPVGGILPPSPLPAASFPPFLTGDPQPNVPSWVQLASRAGHSQEVEAMRSQTSISNPCLGQCGSPLVFEEIILYSIKIYMIFILILRCC